jgi:DNA-binding MarR family transcriptional regulator
MTKKQNFIKWVETLMDAARWDEIEDTSEWSDALDYWNGLQMTKDPEKPKFTENGKLVLAFVKENKDAYNNLFKAKEIGEGLGISSRTASGAMRKLVTDGYVEKIGENPAVYSLTELGIQVDLDAE